MKSSCWRGVGRRGGGSWADSDLNILSQVYWCTREPLPVCSPGTSCTDASRAHVIQQQAPAAPATLLVACVAEAGGGAHLLQDVGEFTVAESLHAFQALVEGLQAETPADLTPLQNQPGHLSTI